MKPSRSHFYLSTLVMTLALSACSDSDDDLNFGSEKGDLLATEVQIVNAGDLSQVIGTATLKDDAEEGVTAVFDIGANSVITPGEHAIHIHARGSCAPADSNRDGELENAGAAGGHFNPAGTGHGDDNGPHPGDSEQYNYTFAADGSFKGEVRFPQVGLFERESLLGEAGTAVIIHAGTDDMVSDPSGNAGARVGCGVIAAADEDFSIEADVVSAADPGAKIGTVTLADHADAGVAVQFDIEANDVIAPGVHAIHIHTNGSCEAADTNDDGEAEPAGAAGGHYNPERVGHGEDNGPHVGDSEALNYTFAEDGSFEGEVIFPKAGLYDRYPLLVEGGTALVIHSGTDDTTTDPTGNAGGRVACVVIAK